jgi:2-hydroxychromene-2-carboxylate isomerase
MPNPIDFYFDFSSPYSFLASEQIEALAARHGRTVVYRPILLGVVFKASGGAPLTEQYGPKASYSAHDFERSARFAGVRYRHPSKFPIGAVGASRALLWLQQHQPDKANAFVRAVFRAFFQDDRDISDAAVVAQIAESIGIDGPTLMQGAQEPAIKDELRKRVEEAVAFGVFGAPTIVVDGERFWGNDRLPQIERWLASGPF